MKSQLYFLSIKVFNIDDDYSESLPFFIKHLYDIGLEYGCVNRNVIHAMPTGFVIFCASYSFKRFNYTFL